MIKLLLKIIICCIAVGYLAQLSVHYYIEHALPTAKMVIKGAGVELEVTDNDSWTTVAKAISAVLSTYLGIKIVNKLFD